MHYDRIEPAVFKERPNRFIAHALINGKQEIVHVKNTGRCKELLIPGAGIYVQKADGEKRKTNWDLIAVEKSGHIINIDSQAPNQAVKEWLEQGNLFGRGAYIRPETKYKSSRFDFYVEKEKRKAFIEVKGVTLEEKGIALFPDAPSERAVKHVGGLIEAVKEGYEAYVFFVIQMKKIKYFTPNSVTHAAFREALKEAEEKGVNLLAYDCNVTSDSMKIDEPVEIVI